MFRLAGSADPALQIVLDHAGPVLASPTAVRDVAAGALQPHLLVGWGEHGEAVSVLTASRRVTSRLLEQLARPRPGHGGLGT